MHYAAAVLMKKGGAYIYYILTADAALETKQFTFCISLFQLTPVDKDLIHDNANGTSQLLQFDSVESLLKSTMF
eukprot:10902558-Ditylum_brightwellii.AAC.1